MKKRARKIAKKTRKSAKEKLSQRSMRQWLRGQQAMNKITQAERRARLQGMTSEQAREIFDELHQGGDNWKKFGGDLNALAQRRTADKVTARQMLDRLARQLKSNESAL